MELTAAINLVMGSGRVNTTLHPVNLLHSMRTSTVKGEVELQLRDNVAYGQVKKVVFIYSFRLNCSQQRVTTVINT